MSFNTFFFSKNRSEPVRAECRKIGKTGCLVGKSVRALADGEWIRG